MSIPPGSNSNSNFLPSNSNNNLPQITNTPTDTTMNKGKPKRRLSGGDLDKMRSIKPKYSSSKKEDTPFDKTATHESESTSTLLSPQLARKEIVQIKPAETIENHPSFCNLDSKETNETFLLDAGYRYLKDAPIGSYLIVPAKPKDKLIGGQPNISYTLLCKTSEVQKPGIPGIKAYPVVINKENKISLLEIKVVDKSQSQTERRIIKSADLEYVSKYRLGRIEDLDSNVFKIPIQKDQLKNFISEEKNKYTQEAFLKHLSTSSNSLPIFLIQNNEWLNKLFTFEEMSSLLNNAHVPLMNSMLTNLVQEVNNYFDPDKRDINSIKNLAHNLKAFNQIIEKFRTNESFDDEFTKLFIISKNDANSLSQFFTGKEKLDNKNLNKTEETIRQLLKEYQIPNRNHPIEITQEYLESLLNKALAHMPLINNMLPNLRQEVINYFDPSNKDITSIKNLTYNLNKFNGIINKFRTDKSFDDKLKFFISSKDDTNSLVKVSQFFTGKEKLDNKMLNWLENQLEDLDSGSEIDGEDDAFAANLESFMETEGKVQEKDDDDALEADFESFMENEGKVQEKDDEDDALAADFESFMETEGKVQEKDDDDALEADFESFMENEGKVQEKDDDDALAADFESFMENDVKKFGRGDALALAADLEGFLENNVIEFGRNDALALAADHAKSDVQEVEDEMPELENIPDEKDKFFPVSQKSLEMQSNLFGIQRRFKADPSLKAQSNTVESVNSVLRLKTDTLPPAAFFKKETQDMLTGISSGIRTMEELAWQISLIFNLEDSFAATKPVTWPKELLTDKKFEGITGSLQTAHKGYRVGSFLEDSGGINDFETRLSRPEFVNATLTTILFAMFDAHGNNLIFNADGKIKFFDNTRSMAHSNSLLNREDSISVPYRNELMRFDKFYNSFTNEERVGIKTTFENYKLKIQQLKKYLNSEQVKAKIDELPPEWFNTNLAISALEERIENVINGIESKQVTNLRDLVFKAFPYFKFATCLKALAFPDNLSLNNIDIQKQIFVTLSLFDVMSMLDKCKNTYDLDKIKEISELDLPFEQVLNKLREYQKQVTEDINNNSISSEQRIKNHDSYVRMQGELARVSEVDSKDEFENPTIPFASAIRSLKEAGFAVVPSDTPLPSFMLDYPKPFIFISQKTEGFFVTPKIFFNVLDQDSSLKSYPIDFQSKPFMLKVKTKDLPVDGLPGLENLGQVTASELHAAFLPKSYRNFASKKLNDAYEFMSKQTSGSFCITFDSKAKEYVVLWKDGGEIKSNRDIFNNEALKENNQISLAKVEQSMIANGFYPV